MRTGDVSKRLEHVACQSVENQLDSVTSGDLVNAVAKTLLVGDDHVIRPDAVQRVCLSSISRGRDRRGPHLFAGFDRCQADTTGGGYNKHGVIWRDLSVVDERAVGCSDLHPDG